MALLPIWVRNMENGRRIKERLRQEVLAERKQLSESEWQNRSRLITHQVIVHPAFLSARKIFLFVNAKGETDTRQIMEAAWIAGKIVAVPRVNRKVMNFFRIDNINQLEPGSFGIYEPVRDREAVEPDADTLMIMPGVVFDIERHRIGYGGGYYDKYLSEHPQPAKTMAVAFALQVKNEIPFEPHDIRPDILITEGNLL